MKLELEISNFYYMFRKSVFSTIRNIFFQRSRIDSDPSFGNCMSNIQYSGGSNTERSKTESIRKPNVLKVSFRMVRFSNGRFHSLELWNRPFENQTFQNGRFSLGHFISIP